MPAGTLSGLSTLPKSGKSAEGSSKEPDRKKKGWRLCG